MKRFNADLREISNEEFLQDSARIVREAADAPVVVCDDQGTPRMIISSPILDDDALDDQ
jgi:hypothetical protein